MSQEATNHLNSRCNLFLSIIDGLKQLISALTVLKLLIVCVAVCVVYFMIFKGYSLESERKWRTELEIKNKDEIMLDKNLANQMRKQLETANFQIIKLDKNLASKESLLKLELDSKEKMNKIFSNCSMHIIQLEDNIERLHIKYKYIINLLDKDLSEKKNQLETANLQNKECISNLDNANNTIWWYKVIAIIVLAAFVIFGIFANNKKTKQT